WNVLSLRDSRGGGRADEHKWTEKAFGIKAQLLPGSQRGEVGLVPSGHIQEVEERGRDRVAGGCTRRSLRRAQRGAGRWIAGRNVLSQSVLACFFRRWCVLLGIGDTLSTSRQNQGRYRVSHCNIHV